MSRERRAVESRTTEAEPEAIRASMSERTHAHTRDWPHCGMQGRPSSSSPIPKRRMRISSDETVTDSRPLRAIQVDLPLAGAPRRMKKCFMSVIVLISLPDRMSVVSFLTIDIIADIPIYIYDLEQSTQSAHKIRENDEE